jgi:dolichol-phosphate mannosyltransferase
MRTNEKKYQMNHLAPSSKICLLLPVLNEIENIDMLLQRISTALTNYPYFICFVDDGSTDGTLEYLMNYVKMQPQIAHLIYRKKMGHGSQRGAALHDALKWSVENIQPDIIVEMDGDLSHRPEELPTGIEIIRSATADIAIASKYITGSRVTNRPHSRKLVSWLGNRVVRSLISRKIKDYSNGFRFYNQRIAKVIVNSKIKHRSPIYLTEVALIWLKSNAKIYEFSTHYVGRNEGLSKLRSIDLLKALAAVITMAAVYHVSNLWHDPENFSDPIEEKDDTDEKEFFHH